MVRAGARKKHTAKSGGTGLLERLRSLAAAFVSPVEEEESESSEHTREIAGIVLIGLSLYLLVSMASYYKPYGDPGARGHNWGGQVGFYYAHIVLISTGIAGYLIGLLGAAWGVVLMARKRVELWSLRVLSGLCFVSSIAFLLQLSLGEHLPISNRLPFGPGGWLALEGSTVLQEKFGGPGLWILLVLTAIVSFMLATQMAFYPLLVELGDWAQSRREERGESLLLAIGRWARQLFLGLWDFVRGAGIGESTAERLDDKSVLVPKEQKRRSRKQKAAEEAAGEDAEESADEADSDEADEDDGATEPELKPRKSRSKKAAAEAREEAQADEEVSQADDDEELVEAQASDEDSADDESAQEGLEIEPQRVTSAKGPAGKKASARQLGAQLPFEPVMPPPGDWKLPPGSLLEPPEENKGANAATLEAEARKLEYSLSQFRVDATVVATQVGPTVILYELEVAQGTRMNKVTQLSSEIAGALRAQNVRIIAPIPGRATIGIEVPNGSRRMVRLSELVTRQAYDKKFAALPLFIGVDAEGQAIVEDLARMPHLLIAGTTGSGKSVCINTILASFLLTRSPHDVQLILIDPKMVELQMFAHIPHLMLPVVTDMKQATAVLNWAVEKMEGRYELFNKAGVRNIKGYNGLAEDELRKRLGDEFSEERTPRHVSYIVVVIDEFADLMMQSKKEAELAITRLAQKSRAVGIHVILATQRPSTDVITGVIKGNLPTRIAFQVASKVDSRVILDVQGAEKLLGGGDMLYNPPASSRVKRVQGALVEDHELQALVDFVCQESAPNFNQELVQAATGTAQPGAGSGFESALEDDMWDEAVRVILRSKRGSASLLQRALGIGYTRASRLLDMMGEAGIVSDHKGSKAREVMMTLEQWEEQNGAPMGQGAGDE